MSFLLGRGEGQLAMRSDMTTNSKPAPRLQDEHVSVVSKLACRWVSAIPAAWLTYCRGRLLGTSRRTAPLSPLTSARLDGVLAEFFLADRALRNRSAAERLQKAPEEVPGFVPEGYQKATQR